MRTEARVLDYSADGRPEGRLVLGLRRLVGNRHLMVFLDQAFVSAGTFLTGWLAARNLKPMELMGNYHLFMQVAFYVYSLQQALVVFPLTIKGATQSKPELSRLTGSSILHTIALAPVLVLIIGISAAFQGKSLFLALLVSVSVVAWLLQETARRALLAHLEHHRALLGDGMRSTIQAGGVFILAWTGQLSLEGIFASLLAGSLIAGVVQAIQLRVRRPTWRELVGNGQEFWRLGRWMLAAASMGVLTTLAFPYALPVFYGREEGARAVAILGAFGSILVFVSPVTQSIVGLILPASARAMASGGIRAAARAAMKGGLLGAAILFPILTMMFLFPQASTRYLLKQQEYVAEYWALRWCVIAQAVMFLGAVIEAFLNSLQKSHSNFMAYVINASAVVVIGLPLTYYDGVRGALIGGIVCVLVRVLATLYFVRRLHWGGEALAEGEAGRVQAGMAVAGDRPILGAE